MIPPLLLKEPLEHIDQRALLMLRILGAQHRGKEVVGMNRLELMKCENLFGMPVAEVFEVNESHPNQAEDNQDKIQRRQLGHESLLLFGRNKIYDNTETNEQQGQKDTRRQLHGRNRGVGHHAKYQYRKAQFSGVIKEFGEVITSVLVHGLTLYRLAAEESR